MPGVTLLVDAGNFHRVIDELQKMSGASRAQILLEETAQILRICFRQTPPTKNRSLEAMQDSVKLRVQKPYRYVNADGTLVTRANNRVPRPVPLESGKPFMQTMTGTRGGSEGQQWLVVRRRNGTRAYISGERLRGQKYRTVLGKAIVVFAETEPRVESSVAAIGSVKKSWLQIGEALGIDVSKVIRDQANLGAIARAARSRFNDGSGSRLEENAEAIYVHLENTNDALINRYGGEQMLRRAIRQRENAFYHNVKSGVFADLRARAARYPGIFTSSN